MWDITIELEEPHKIAVEPHATCKTQFAHRCNKCFIVYHVLPLAVASLVMVWEITNFNKLAIKAFEQTIHQTAIIQTAGRVSAH